MHSHSDDYEIRRRQVLLTVIETFIETALPVGSRAVTQMTGLRLSPATIRNVMAELEQEGYLTHPHTSAGRIPTAKGYRFYVDELVTSERLTELQEQQIEEAFRQSEMVEKALGRVARVLGEITRQVGVVLCPQTGRSLLKRIELIPMRGKEVLVVLVTDAGAVENAIVLLEEEAGKGELARIAHFLNTELIDQSLSEIHENLYRRLLDERSSFFYVCKRAREILEKSALMADEGELLLDGTRNILEHPEFQRFDQFKPVLSLLEEKKELLRILKRDAESEGLHIYIGEEGGLENFRGCTLITSSYRIGNRRGGTLGVIGPTRLPYRRVIAAVNHVASRISKWMEMFE